MAIQQAAERVQKGAAFLALIGPDRLQTPPPQRP